MLKKYIPKDWLRKLESYDELNNLNKDWTDWQVFIKNFIQGDELWSFCSFVNSWGSLCGRAGFVIVRKDEQLKHILTSMN